MKKIIIIVGFILCAGCTKDFNPNFDKESKPNFDKEFELAEKRWEREIRRKIQPLTIKN